MGRPFLGVCRLCMVGRLPIYSRAIRTRPANFAFFENQSPAKEASRAFIVIVTVTGVPRGVFSSTRGVTLMVAFDIPREERTSFARWTAWLCVRPGAVAIRAASYEAIFSDCLVKIALDASIIPTTSVTAIGRITASSTVAVPSRFRSWRARRSEFPPGVRRLMLLPHSGAGGSDVFLGSRPMKTSHHGNSRSRSGTQEKTRRGGSGTGRLKNRSFRSVTQSTQGVRQMPRSRHVGEDFTLAESAVKPVCRDEPAHQQTG